MTLLLDCWIATQKKNEPTDVGSVLGNDARIATAGSDSEASSLSGAEAHTEENESGFAVWAAKPKQFRQAWRRLVIRGGTALVEVRSVIGDRVIDKMADHGLSEEEVRKLRSTLRPARWTAE